MSTSRITYRVAEQHVGSFGAFMQVHERILAEAGLVTDVIQLAVDTKQGVEYTEIIHWVDEHGEQDAHLCDDIRKLWAVLETCCESRGDLPPMSVDTARLLATV